METTHSSRRILVVGSNPKGLKSLSNVKLEVREIRNIIDNLNLHDCEVKLISEYIENADFEYFQKVLRQFKPNFIHFCGHGNENGLFFQSKYDDTPEEIPSGDLINLIKIFRSTVELFFLNCCESKEIANSFCDKIDYAIGINGEIEDYEAKAFSTSFYDGISKGFSIEDSFEMALLEVKSDLAMPSLLLKSRKRKCLEEILTFLEKDGFELIYPIYKEKICEVADEISSEIVEEIVIPYLTAWKSGEITSVEEFNGLMTLAIREYFKEDGKGNAFLLCKLKKISEHLAKEIKESVSAVFRKYEIDENAIFDAFPIFGITSSKEISFDTDDPTFLSDVLSPLIIGITAIIMGSSMGLLGIPVTTGGTLLFFNLYKMGLAKTKELIKTDVTKRNIPRIVRRAAPVTFFANHNIKASLTKQIKENIAAEELIKKTSQNFVDWFQFTLERTFSRSEIPVNNDSSQGELEKFTTYKEYLAWFEKAMPACQPFSEEEFYTSLRCAMAN